VGLKQSVIDMLSVLDDDLRMLDDEIGRPLLASLATYMARRILKDDVTIGFDCGWWHRVGRYYVPDGQLFHFCESSALAWKDEVPNYFRDAQDHWFNGYRPKPGDWVVDVGAGRGEDVLLFSEAVGTKGKVFAIEAQPETFRRLKRFCELNRLANVVPIHAAVMEEPGTVYIEDDNSAGWIANSVSSAGTGHAVPAFRFDDLRRAHDISRINFLKMNIEGAERSALLGMTETLTKLNNVCICAHDFRADRGEGEQYRTRDFVVDVLTKNGFAVTRRSWDPRVWVQDHIFGTRNMLSQLSTEEEWISLSVSALRRTRVFTPKGRALYVDVPSGALRHGEISPDQANVFFVPHPRLSEAGGWLVCNSDETWQPIACSANGSSLSSTAAITGEWTAPTFLEMVRLERGLIAFTSDRLFLCAEEDGRVTLSRPVCSYWECFLAAEDWLYDNQMETKSRLVAQKHRTNAVEIAKIAIAPLTRVNVNMSTTKKRVAFFGPLQWSNGRVYYDVCKQLYKHGYVADLLNYREIYGSDIEKIKRFYEFFVAGLEDAMHVLVDIYGVSFDKIIGISHWTFDIQSFIERYGRESFSKLAGYGVVGNTLLWDSLTLGVTRLPKVVPLGINYDEFLAEPPRRLATVGYATSLSAKNRFGIEIKRGALAQECAERAGLTFRPAGFWSGQYTPIHDMPAYYRSVDALLVTSMAEAGGPMPATEAAASGRLVISTPVGVFPLRAYEGMGIMAPMESEAYKKFTVDALLYYKDNPMAFVEKCRSTQAAAKLFDWNCVIPEWVDLLESSRNPK